MDYKHGILGFREYICSLSRYKRDLVFFSCTYIMSFNTLMTNVTDVDLASSNGQSWHNFNFTEP